jgi:hypothetical protein
VIDALLAVPLGAVAVLVLVSVELDEAFANVYSTASRRRTSSPGPTAGCSPWASARSPRCWR